MWDLLGDGSFSSNPYARAQMLKATYDKTLQVALPSNTTIYDVSTQEQNSSYKHLLHAYVSILSLAVPPVAYCVSSTVNPVS